LAATLRRRDGSAFGEFARRWLAAEGDTEPDVADLLEPFEDAGP
jgi:hypothetical protein